MSGAQQSLAMCEGCGEAGVHLGPFEAGGRSWERICVSCKSAIFEADPTSLAQIEELRASRAALAARTAGREVAEAARAAGLGEEPLKSVEVVSSDDTSALEEAATRGDLRLEVEERPLFRDGMAYHDALRGLPEDEPIRVVHVISVPARGEVRGYVIARGALHVRQPEKFTWPEMDAWVCSQLGVTMANGGSR